jgi:hypothetical protein
LLPQITPEIPGDRVLRARVGIMDVVANRSGGMQIALHFIAVPL